MAQDILAPWAEAEPDAGLMTIDQLLALPDDDHWVYEVVEGRLVRMPASGVKRHTSHCGWRLPSARSFTREILAG